jgi:hypothetical protein
MSSHASMRILGHRDHICSTKWISADSRYWFVWARSTEANVRPHQVEPGAQDNRVYCRRGANQPHVIWTCFIPVGATTFAPGFLGLTRWHPPRWAVPDWSRWHGRLVINDAPISHVYLNFSITYTFLLRLSSRVWTLSMSCERNRVEAANKLTISSSCTYSNTIPRVHMIHIYISTQPHRSPRASVTLLPVFPSFNSYGRSACV